MLKILLKILLVKLLFISFVQAHENHHTDLRLRLWTNKLGFELHATLLSITNGYVNLLTENGITRTIPIKDLSQNDQDWIKDNYVKDITKIPIKINNNIEEINSKKLISNFTPFQDTLKFRVDKKYLYIESNGLPSHQMMVGIKNWQQQVPLPQNYTGSNAWSIPLNPIPAKQPILAKNNFFRGAIALAVNGVPIFNPIKNDGKTDTFLAGELDEYGGHCGRADDYHYHIAPLHLQKVVGTNKPIAYALDGYPIYGTREQDGSKVENLDKLNGHLNKEGKYHYHATVKYPYINGGFYGEIYEKEGQAEPQPKTFPIRPSLKALPGARIIGFKMKNENKFSLTYIVKNSIFSINYEISNNGFVTFNFKNISKNEVLKYKYK